MCLHMPRVTKVDEYLNRWYGVSAHTAAEILIQIGYGNNVMDWNRPEKSPDEVYMSTWFVNMHARDVGTFYFMGGPPKYRRLIRGTLLMFLVDRLLFTEAIRYKYAV